MLMSLVFSSRSSLTFADRRQRSREPSRARAGRPHDGPGVHGKRRTLAWGLGAATEDSTAWEANGAAEEISTAWETNGAAEEVSTTWETNGAAEDEVSTTWETNGAAEEVSTTWVSFKSIAK